jgi:hypothetical protein
VIVEDRETAMSQKTPHPHLSRRELVRYGAVAAAAAGFRGQAHAQGRRAGDERILFVVSANGGASIMDSFLPILRSARTPAALNAYAAAELDQGPGELRCVKDIPYTLGSPVGPQYSMIDFLQRHGSDATVVTQQVTSVNHLIAAERSLNGNNADRTRTLMEQVAARYGEGLLFPNVNMAIGPYAVEGRDVGLPAFARAASVGDALLFPLSTHASKGVEHAPDAALITRARLVRDRLDAASPFTRSFQAAPMLQRYLASRTGIPAVEASGLIRKLMLIDEARQGIPLSRYGLESSEDIAALQAAFPGLGSDPFHGQAALAFLLAKYGVSCAITLGLADAALFTGAGRTARLENLPLAFDWSHNDHRGAQNTMWRRVLQVVDSLITLLKAEDYLGDPANGKIWDRSLIYVATEFGRSKNTQGGGSRGSGHDLNNGSLLISPRLRGGRVYGGIDDATGLTYGFDPATGASEPGRTMSEKDVYSLACHALGVEFPGRVDMPGLVRSV